MGNIGIIELLIVIVISVVVILPMWRIVSKTGLPGVLSLLSLIPLVNVVFLFVLAFAKWPIEKELEAARKSGT